MSTGQTTTTRSRQRCTLLPLLLLLLPRLLFFDDPDGSGHAQLKDRHLQPPHLKPQPKTPALWQTPYYEQQQSALTPKPYKCALKPTN